MDTHFQSKVGVLYSRVNREGGLDEVGVELRKDRLAVKRTDHLYEDIIATHNIIDERRVVIERDEDEGLGIAIQGGTEFKYPIKIHKVIENSPASRSAQVYDGDVLLEVNGTTLWGKTHEEAVGVLKSAGKNITLYLAKLEPKPEGERQAEGGERMWLAFTEVPLLLASVTQFHRGTAILRPNTFQVLGRDGKTKVSLHCDEHTPGQMKEWVGAINERIRELNKQEAERLNNTLLEWNEQVVLIGCVYEHQPSNVHTKIWKRKFLALKRMQLHIFNTYPETVEEWLRPEKSYKLLEMTVRVLKAHELSDQRANSILVTSGTGENHLLSFENQTNVALWTQSIHNTTVGAVRHLEKQQFLARWKGRDVQFSLDVHHGFIIYDRENLAHLWSKEFHWLKMSSDDGQSILHLVFTIPNSHITETQDIELQDLQMTVCTMEAFLAARVASLDPNFILQTDLVAQ